MNLQAKTDKVDELRSKFVDFLKSKDAPTAEDYESLERMDVELKAAETDLERAASFKSRQDEIEGRLLAEREEINAGIRRPLILPAVQTKSPAEDDAVEYDEPVNIARPGALSQIFLTSPGYKQLARTVLWPSKDERVEAKAVRRVKMGVETKAAGDPILTTNFNVIRTDTEMAEHWFRIPSVYDMVPKVTANASSIRYLQATEIPGPGAAPVVEAAPKPEAQPRWVPKDAPLETIAVWTAVTIQSLADVPQLRQLIDADLRALVLDETDDQIINGTGVPPNLLGLLNVPGIGTATGADLLTGIASAMTELISTRAGVPTVILINPADWQALRLTNSNGIYYWGPPTEAGIMRVFGVPVLPTPNIAAGTTLVADFRFVVFFQSMGITFIVGWKNDDIVRNIQTIVCELRGALVVRRPQALVKVTVTP